MKLTFLGTGTSQGVPTIGCRCTVCRSTDPRDRRLRSSALVEWQGKRLLVDAGPDLRYQLLRAEVRHLDGILLTHEHKDHIGGLDDVRALNFVDYPEAIHPTDIYATHRTLTTVRKDFDYAFVTNKYRGVPEIRLHEIAQSEPFCIGACEIVPIAGQHSSRFEVTGYRFGRLAYLTDFKQIAEAEVEKLMGVEVLVVNALRHTPHDSHFNVEEALALIGKVQPHRALLTHMSHEIGRHAEAQELLDDGVVFAYDGLSVEIE